MAQGIGTFGDHFTFFFLYDDKARWKAIRWIIFIVGTAGSYDLAVLNSPVDDVVLLMGTLTLIMSVAWVGGYCTFRQWSSEPRLPSRRSLVFQGIASVIAFVIAESWWQLEAKALNMDLSQAANSGDYAKATDIFERARNAKVRLDRAVTKTAGLRFLNTAKRPDAWTAAMASLGYRSLMEEPPLPIDPHHPPRVTTAYALEVRNGHAPQVYVIGIVPAEQAAHLDSIGIDQNFGKKYGIKTIVVNGGEIIIDGLDMKNVVFQKSGIIYNGGPVKMENVYFLDCDFEIVQSQSGKALALAILSSNPVSTSNH